MNLHNKTNEGGSASEVIRPEYGVDDSELEDRDKQKAEEEREEEQRKLEAGYAPLPVDQR